MINKTYFQKRRSIVCGGLIGGLSTLWGNNLLASQMTPIISTGSPGSSMDYLARGLAEHFTKKVGGTFNVENIQAAGGGIAAKTLLSRNAGSSLMVAHSGLLCSYPLLNPDGFSFNPVEDLVPVGIPTGTPVFLVTGRDSGFVNASQLRALRGHEVLFAAGQQGASGHLGGMVLIESMQAKPVPVFYTRNSQALLDVTESRVAFGVFSWPAISAFVEAGKVSVLCVLSDKRVPFAAHVPTAIELGFDVSIEGWVGLFMRQGTSDGLIQTYASSVDSFMSEPSLPKFLDFGGLSKRFIRRPDASAFIRKEIERYSILLKRYNIIK